MKRIHLIAFVALASSVQVASADTLLSIDFNDPKAVWPAAATDVMPATPLAVEPTIQAKAVGTVDVAGSTEASGGMLLSAQVGSLNEPWEAIFASGPLAVTTQETNLGKLTLAFDLSATSARPVTVRISSFNAQKRITGTLEGSILPAAPAFYQRFVLDLSLMKPVGEGKFNPADPFVQVTLAIAGPAWGPDATHELRLDNVHYATPSLYVSPMGDDANDGRTEDKPLRDPQLAVDRAKPGDIVVLMEGEHRRGPKNTVQDGIVAFRHAGSPAAWITLKNYPGHKPVLRSDAWNAIQIRRSKNDSVQADPVLAYLEVRGLTLIGNSDEVKEKHTADIGQPKATTNGNGISGDGSGFEIPPHHLRFADNIAEKFPGGGIGTGQCDWVTIENNISRNNCWYTIYATSGFGLLGWMNFDAQDNVYKCLIRNNVAQNNRTYSIWKQIGKISDGNGIIIDTTYDPAKGHAYLGRTLIQNNVSYNNGGSGIHCFKTRRVDIVNNTAYLNGATPELAWGQIFVQRTDDAQIINNVLWGRDRQPTNTVSKHSDDKGNTNIVRANNIYVVGRDGFGPIMGQDDRVVPDAGFLAPAEWTEGDFRLKPDSPAIGHGQWSPIVPVVDINGRPRPTDGKPAAGAHQN